MAHLAGDLQKSVAFWAPLVHPRIMTTTTAATAALIEAEANLRSAMAAMQRAIRASRKEIVSSANAAGLSDCASDFAPSVLETCSIAAIREDARAAVKTAKAAPGEIALLAQYRADEESAEAAAKKDR